MSQVITDAFASYWQQCLVDETPVELDEFVLAYVPGLDPDAPIDPASGLPLPEQIVHRHAVDQRGRINNDAVAYSIVMDTTVGDFTFNAMYLINSAQNLVAMIVHKGDEAKLKTDPANGQTGNSLVKSMLMEYDRAAEASETVIDASTWQIDYAARLRGMDEDLRRQALGTFGQAAFYGDGFKLVNASGLYKVQPGQGYVGGLLALLTSEQEVTPSAKPTGLWLDVYRAGTLLSPWVNHLTLTLSAADLVDYVDANGYPHFVTKLAVINADDSVTDTRARRTLTLTGDVTGEANFNGPDSIQLEVAIKDNSHAHTIENVAGLPEELDSRYPKSGGPIGDFWRGDSTKRYGGTLVLGLAGDAKASLVILAKKYVGTALAKTGFIGRLLFDRGLATSTLQSDFVDLAVSSAYQNNSASMLFRSGGTVAAAKIVEVTYNGEPHFALYRPVTSAATVVAVGHAFTQDLPVLVPDATAYAITDVATTERIYHWGNKPTPAEIAAMPSGAPATNTAGYVAITKPGTALGVLNEVFDSPEGEEALTTFTVNGKRKFAWSMDDSLTLRLAEYDSSTGAYIRTLLSVDPNTGLVSITNPKSASAMGTTAESLVRLDYLNGQLPNRYTGIGASKDLNTYQTPGFYSQPGNADAISGSNYPADVAGVLLVFKHAGICQVYITYTADGSRRIFHRNLYGTTWSAWATVYDTNFKPTAADVGAAPTSHTHFETMAALTAAFGTTYTNTSGKTMFISITTLHGGDDDTVECWVNGNRVSYASIAMSGEDSDGTNFCQGFFVPNGGTWVIKQVNGTETSIQELWSWK